MSAYRDFNRDVIERSVKNLERYKGKYEVTMLLNTLYMVLINPIEFNNNAPKAEKLTLNVDSLVKCLKCKGIVNDYGNDFKPQKIISLLRNGLAHMNIEVIDDNEDNKIEKIKIFAQNYKQKVVCPNCEHEFISSRQYREDKGKICAFEFKVDELESFVFLVMNNILGKNTCECNCEEREYTDVNPNLR